MPVPDFLSSIADKAQSAINQTPLAGHIPGTTSVGDPSPGHAGPQSGRRSLAFESLQHQIRSLGQQYTSTTPVQRIITLEKGVALDLDALARDGKSQSKELYTWGQDQDPDLKDVTDRLAFLNFVHGSLSATLAVKLDNARSSLKALRSAEAAITPKRNVRAGLRNQIARLEHNHEKGGERRLAELKEQLSRAEKNDEQLEKELELLKRKAVRESEQIKWEAIQEYGEKLVLLSQAAKPIIGALPSLPPTSASAYSGAKTTAAARASLQHALDNYKPGVTYLAVGTGDLSRSDTRSFGESHASELSPVAEQDGHPGLSVTPPIPEPGSTEHSVQPGQSPAPAQPVRAESTSEDLYDSAGGNKTEGEERQLEQEERARVVAASHEIEHPGESAKEEKRRLEQEERARVVAAGHDTEHPGESESAEEEKKRLEREERARVLAGGAAKDGDELPAYQDIE